MPPTPILPDPAILERNLAALARSSSRTAELIRAAAPRTDVEFFEAEDKAVSAQIGAGPSARALASRRRPLDEARRLADTVDLTKAGCLVVTGFGLGHHVAALARRLERTGVMLVFEPDVALLRAVLERIDHSAWLLSSNTAILTDPDDRAAISRSIAGLEPIVALGVKLVDHPASRERLGDAARRFESHVATTVEAVRTASATTLVKAMTTMRNLTQNVGDYARCAGIADLADAARGRAAIVIAAGPSLHRQLDLLAEPGLRDRFVIIAVQTVLKPLLQRGIRPHFVTALDYHEMSRRFYEGLTAEDVEGVTLVAEPKCNPAIVEAFPGDKRFVGDNILDQLLGENLAKENTRLTPGATVAHLAYYLARHLGCDPVILVGQDLGFTDGQYYSAGAAIHQVWSAELNVFNTLEMLEWQRIVRMGASLREATDTLGRPILTDEQMSTYLEQFQRDFAADAEKGLRTIDATDGGVAKSHTTPMPLAEALAAYAGADAPPIRLPAARVANPPSTRRVEERVREVRQGAWRIGDLSRKTKALLEDMLAHHADQRRVNDLIARVEAIRDEVMKTRPAFDLTQFVNQAGQFKRLRADRELHLARDLDPLERQRKQIERDIMNVSWLAEAADELGAILDDAAAVLAGTAPKKTHEPVAAEITVNDAPPPLPALIWVDLERSGLGTRRDLAREFLFGMNPLRMALVRLARARLIDRAILLCPDPDAAAALAGPPIPGLPVQTVQAGPRAPTPIGPGRMWAESCWRGGLGNLSIYDEAFDPRWAAEAMHRLGLEAAVFVGADWALVDPALCDEAVRRYRESPVHHRFTFAHAAPGLSGCVVACSLADDLAPLAARGMRAASLGGLLAYQPAAPVLDPIGQRVCVTPAPHVRDLTERAIPDSQTRRAFLRAALGPLGQSLLEADAEVIAAIVAERALSGGAGSSAAGETPSHTIIELCTGRLSSGRRAHWERGSIGFCERRPMPLALAERIFNQLADGPGTGAGGREDAAVTFGGAGDPLRHPDWRAAIEAARRAGVAAIHVRTDLLCDERTVDELFDAAPDVISIDLMADTPETYRLVMGVDRYREARRNIERLLNRRAASPGGVGPWIVPRITRCDTVYAEIRSFYDRWLMAAGACVIDPLPLSIPGNRIAPLPRPETVVRRDHRRRMLVLSDGTVPLGERDIHAAGPTAGNLSRDPVVKVWRSLVQARRETARHHGADHPRIQMAS